MSDTRLESWIKIQPELARRQRQVLEEMEKNTQGLTAPECARLLNRQAYVVRPRIRELVKAGILEDSGIRRFESTTQRRQAVWRLIRQR